MTFDDLKHAQRERLTFLDRCLLWRGVANRRDLMDRFKISEPQAAIDFKAYLALNRASPPTYDAARKTYVAARPHQPITPCSVDEAFDILRDDLLACVPSALPRPARTADPTVLSRLHQAIRGRCAMHIAYTSMTSGPDAGRWIAPTRFMSDGQAIYLRAYSFRHEEHRTYLPIRISPKSDFLTKPLAEPLPPDDDWNTKATIWLRPKRSLSQAQQEVVRLEYGFTDDRLSVVTRKPLEFLFDRRWGLDQDSSRLERDETAYEALDPQEAGDVAP